MINKNGKNSIDERMEAEQISNGASTSFSKECIGLCSAESRKKDVLGNKKKREEARKVLEKIYHYQE